ncbi:MAG: glycosyltransferase family 4 protein [Actinomycetia bacterium]|nr:glycosyltransferase family 4 protein [Actinomycetes bacterium]
MRIAEIHWAFPPTIGGVETHLAVLTPALLRRGHTVSLLVGQPEGTPSRQSWQGVPVVRTPYLDLNQMDDDRFQALRAVTEKTIETFLTQVDPDVIHVHNLHYFSPVPLDAVLAFATREDVPVVLTAHNTWHDERFRDIARRAGAYARIIAVSHFIRADLVRLGYPEDRIVVVHHGVPDEWWEKPPAVAAGPRTGGPVIFHPARMSLGKGSDVVIRAFARVRRRYPEARLLLAGTERTVDWHQQQSAEIAGMMEIVRELGLEGAVAWRPFAWQEMMPAYDGADVVVYPSVMPEPFGIVAIEAMARARPLIVSDRGGLPEIVEHEISGLVVPGGSEEALADAILRLLDDPVTARRLGQAARERVRRAFRAEDMIDRTEAALVAASRQVTRRVG